MIETPIESRHYMSNKQKIQFLVKGFVLVGVLAFIAREINIMPAWLIAIVWAALSAFCAIGFVYPSVIKKSYKQFQYKKGGRLSSINEGRTIRFIIAYVLSAVFVAGLILEMPKWSIAEWIIALCSIPLYLAVSFLVRKMVSSEYEAPFRTSKTIRWSTLVIGLILCIAYLIVLLVQVFVIDGGQPYVSPAEMFLKTSAPFDGSVSAIVWEAGFYSSFMDALVSSGLSAAASYSAWGYVLLAFLMEATALFGFAGMIASLSLRINDIKRIFSSVDTMKANQPRNRLLRKRYVVFACVLPIAFAAAFIVADDALANAREADEYIAVHDFIRDQIGVRVVQYGDEYLDADAVRVLKERAEEKAFQLSEDVKAELVPLINKVYDQQIENVDSYLDWYYSLPADYERLAKFFAGTVEEGMKQQLVEKLNENINTEEIDNLFADYYQEAAEINEEYLSELENYKLDGIPEWLVKPSTDAELLFDFAPPEPTQKLLDYPERIGLSAGVGVVSGVAVKKVIVKPVFEKMVSKLVSTLASRGIIHAASTAGGTVIAPGVGTAIGVAAGVGASVLWDYLSLKGDEFLNREQYKEEIIGTIEESRKEMLAMLQGE